MNTKVLIGIVAVVILAGVGVYASKGSSTQMVQNDAMMQKEQIMKDEGMQKEQMMKDEAMKTDETDMTDKGDATMKAGSYESYSPEKIARAETGDVVLFFHASWCPSCRGLNADIESNSSAIPEGISILKLDYDKETELKKKYGVTTQHTLVQVDKDGTLVKKWSGGATLKNLVSEIQ